MRRATAAVFGTLTGAALLLGAKFGADNVAGTAVANQTADGTGGLGPPSNGSQATPRSSGGAAPPAGGGGAAPPAGGGGAPAGGGGAPAAGGAAAANGLRNGVFRGEAAVNQYGPIQVTIRVANGRITGLTATHATDQARTVQVNTRAIPLLRQQVLTSQSARVDTVSGATATSGSFATSLQSALAAARG